MKNSSIPKFEPLHAKAGEKSSNMLSPKPVRTTIDIDLKKIFSKYYVPGSRCVTCSSFTDRRYPKNAKKYLYKKGHKMVKNQNFEKLLKICLNIDLKIIFSKH